MNHLHTLTAEQVARAAAVLSHPGLIRLVSEIDDHGPVERHMLQRIFADLTRHQIRHAIKTGRDHELIRAGHHAAPCYLLTDRGTDLAEVYDQAARWARTHNYPAASSDFVTRVQATLTLLSHGPVIDAVSGVSSDCVVAQAARTPIDAGLMSDSAAVADLHQPWTALSQWVRTNQSVLSTTEHLTAEAA
jgi:DNA-binding HxlR family transcriptional regulator